MQADDERVAIDEPVQGELLDTGALQRNLEAVLFVASEPLSIKALAKLTGAEEAAVSTALARIDADFTDRGRRLPVRELARRARRSGSLPVAAEDQSLAGRTRNAGDRRL